MRLVIRNSLPWLVLGFLLVWGAFSVVPVNAQASTPTPWPTSTPWATPAPTNGSGGGWPTDLPTLPACDMTAEPSVTPLSTIDVPTLDIPTDFPGDGTPEPTAGTPDVTPTPGEATPTGTATPEPLVDLLQSEYFVDCSFGCDKADIDGELYCDVNTPEYASCTWDADYSDNWDLYNAAGGVSFFVRKLAGLDNIYIKFFDIDTGGVPLSFQFPYWSGPSYCDGCANPLPTSDIPRWEISVSLSWEFVSVFLYQDGGGAVGDWPVSGTFVASIDPELVITPTPGPTGTPDPGGDPCDPFLPCEGPDCVDLDPPVLIPGECFAVMPQVLWDLTWLDAPLFPTEDPPDFFPDELSVPGFSICVSYLDITATFLGFDAEYFLIVLCGLTAIAIVFRQMSS